MATPALEFFIREQTGLHNELISKATVCAEHVCKATMGDSEELPDSCPLKSGAVLENPTDCSTLIGNQILSKQVQKVIDEELNKY